MDTRGDQYGNRVGQTDAYGKPVHGTTADDFSSNPQTQGHQTTTRGQAQMMRPTTEERVGQPEGMVEKIKENLPGGHGQPQTHGTNTTTGGGYGSGDTPTATGITHVPLTRQHEKKGMGEKIKENLPGGHGQPQTHGTTGHGGGGTNTTTGGGYGGATTGQHEKGMAEKIKENLPGGHGQAQTHGTTGHGGGGGYGGDNTTATGATHVPAAGQHEKKGMAEKIKENLPGGHGQPQTHGTTGGHGGTNTTATGTTHVPAGGQQEKKGMVEKIKEKLPGGKR